MGRYRKVDPKIWNDAKFRRLSDKGKLVFLFILTHPHMTSLGAMRATIPGLAAELGWTPKGFREAFTEAFREGLFQYDENACFLGLPNFLKYNPPESANVVKSWHSQWDQIPECSLKVQLVQRVKGFVEAYGEGFGKAFGKTFQQLTEHPSPNPEPEPEPDIPPKSPKGDLGSLSIPKELDTPEFQAAWKRWISYRKESGHKLTPTGAKATLAKFSEWGAKRAIAAIDHTICMGWQGLQEPKSDLFGKTQESLTYRDPGDPCPDRSARVPQ